MVRFIDRRKLICPDDPVDITLDMEGYKRDHHHDRDASGQTSLRTHRQDHQQEFLRSPLHNPASDTAPLVPIQSEINSPYAPSPTSSSPSSSRPGSPSQGHPFRATSEPPPEIQIEHIPPPAILISTSHTPSVQEYSWEWGAFPQPSPLKASFGKGGRLEPPKSVRKTDRSHLSTLHIAKSAEWKEDQPYSAHGRSRSVPPDLNASPTRQTGRIYKEYEDFENEDDSAVEEATRPGRWERQWFPHIKGLGRTSTYSGTLSPSQDDGTFLVLSVDGSRIDFQLSLVSFEEIREGDDMSELFNQYLVTFDRFLEDESVVQDPRLVLRWGGHQYVGLFSSSSYPLTFQQLHTKERWFSSHGSPHALA